MVTLELNILCLKMHKLLQITQKQFIEKMMYKVVVWTKEHGQSHPQLMAPLMKVKEQEVIYQN